jgi:hypothetical protein
MRIPILLLFGLLVAAVAPVHGQATVDSLQSIPSLKFDLANADDMAIDQYRLPQKYAYHLDRLLSNDAPEGKDQVCYTMRSYKVERTERIDESTAPMKYSTCLPSSGFDVKKADESVVEPKEPQP